MSPTIALRAFDLDLRSPLTTADRDITERRGIAVRYRSRKGEGYGEATPLPGWTEEYDDCRRALEALPDVELRHVLLPREPAARHAVQLATLDYAARRADVPLASYLAAEEYPPEIPINATIGNLDRQTSVERVRSAVEDGYTTIKCKVGGRAIDAEAERLTAIREAVGTGPTLRLDANRAWGPDEAKDIWPILADLDVAYVEEPLHAPTPTQLETFAESAVGVAIDETVYDTDRPMATWFPMLDAIVIKPMAIGGIDRALALAMAAIARGVQPVISGTVDAVIGRTAAIHLAATIPERAPAGLGTAQFLESDLATDPSPVCDGHISVPDGPGIGTRGPWEGAIAE